MTMEEFCKAGGRILRKSTIVEGNLRVTYVARVMGFEGENLLRLSAIGTVSNKIEKAKRDFEANLLAKIE